MRRRVRDFVTRLPYQPDSKNGMGQSRAAWGPPEKVGIFEFNPGGSVEPELSGHSRVVTTPTLYLPYGSPFKPRDRVEVEGYERPFEVEGHPARWKHRRTGREIGDVVNLKLVEG